MIDRRILLERLEKATDLLLEKGVIHSKSDLARAINKDPKNLMAAFSNSGRAMTLGLLTRVADTFPDILNRDYLLTGEGDVAAPDRSMRPHFEATARAGFMTGLSTPETGSLRPRDPYMPDYDFSITVEGDSMLPRIGSGDILYCRRSLDRANPPIGKVCVIDTKDGPVVKVLTAATDESVTLHSLNPAYADRFIPTDAILGIAQVIGLTRLLI